MRSIASRARLALPGSGDGLTPRRHEMKTPDDVVAMVRLHQLGWGSRRIARELGIARSTVIHYIREVGWKPYKKPDRVRCLEEHEGWLRAQSRKHRGNAVVVQRELKREHGIDVALVQGSMRAAWRSASLDVRGSVSRAERSRPCRRADRRSIRTTRAATGC